MKALILAGGFGTRLQGVVKDVPKPMASIAGKPFLEHQIRYLKRQGINEFILGVHYKSDVIKSYFGNGMRQDVSITYSEEDSPLGTGGAIKLAQKFIDGPFLVLNGDSYTDLDLGKFMRFHEKNNSVASMVLQKMEKDNSHYGNVELEGDTIKRYSEKKSVGKGLSNSGIYLFDQEIFDYIPGSKKISLEERVFPELVKKGAISGFVNKGYFVDIGRPETYLQFKKDFIEKLQSSKDIILRDAIKKMYENGSDILFMVNEEKEFQGLLTDGIIKRYLIRGGEFEAGVDEAMIEKPERIATIKDSEDKIRGFLKEGVKNLPILDEQGKIYDIRFRTEEVKGEEYPTIRGKTPLRISFAGGGTDMPYFFEKYGGAVISTTIDKYCNITAKKRGDSKIVINSDILEEEVILDAGNLKYDRSKFDLVKSVYNLVNPGCGVDLHLNNDVPPGRGLGSSASFAVLLTKILGKLKGSNLSDEEVAEFAYRAEVEELGIRGGKQDQYAAVFGGFNWMEFENGNRKIMTSLRIKEDTLNELKDHLTLCYTGKEHESIHQQKLLEDKFKKENQSAIERLKRMKLNAREIKNYLLSPTPDFQRIGEITHKIWTDKKKTSSKVTSKVIENLYEVGMTNGSYGGKLLGSGGGGYLLFFHPPEKRNKLERGLSQEGGEIMNFNFTEDGAKIWVPNK